MKTLHNPTINWKRDLGLLVKMGTRRALFPNQRLAPLMHVVAIVMLLGLFPGIFQFATEQLFVDPQILEVRGISAHMLPAFAAESKRKNYVLLLGQDPSLHVKTKSAQTSSIELCCETDPESLANCTDYVLEHSLIQFDEKPAILKIPAVAATNCSLTARGLSKKSWTMLELMVELQDLKHVCGCSKNNCSCCDGYEGGLVAEGEELQNMLAKDVCTPVSCAIKSSNQKAGPECRCSSGFVGDISWNGTQVSGTCTPAPCYVEDSNRKAGHECQCKDGFSGEVSWNQSEAVGPCRSANCSSIRNSIGMGTDCKCRDGFAGNISWNRSQPLGSCVPAPGCAESIEHSVGEGLQCECQDGFTGNIRWRGAVPQGSCQAAECNVVNSNRQPGLGCRCLDGYQGDIKWQKSHASGACTPARCTITNSNQEPGQACACLKGYKGEITWNNQTPLGECGPASCAHIANSTGAGPGCHCSDGFVGEVTWSGSKASGDCKPAECAISNSNMKLGPACKCNEGFWGDIYFRGSRAYGHCSPLQCLGSHSNRKEGLGCGCEDGFQLNGSRVLLDQERAWRKYKKSASRAFEVNCVPAPCNIEHSNMKPGKECRCADGYYGSVRWEGADPTGSCKAASCRKQNSNRKPGLECKCSDGFAGQITWSGQWESGTCLPAPCNISNSNGKPGKACMCLDGFLGEIVWTDDTAHGSCKPAPCSIRNSNLQPGPDCQCKDGFRGSISWDGSLAKGACKLVPCRVLHSNFAPGPACRCLRGFFGRISWSGPNVTGLCAPRPLCRPGNSVYYITRLTAGLVDADNNTCRAGQAMLVRGNTEGVLGRYKLLWTSAHALPPAKCKLEWLGLEAKNPDPKHFSLTSNCATTPGQPRCSSRIVYSATIRNTSYCACDASEASEHTLAEFRGSRCGYDLIKWESLTISPGSPDACTCNLSLPCSELPSEELPRACIHFAEPAVLSVSDLDDDDDEDDDVDAEEYFYIFYETGELLIASADLGTFDDQYDYRWISDGKNLLIRIPGGARLWHGRAAGSRFSDRIETLLARTVLPEWWKVKFQQDAALGSFNTDKLAGCEFSFKSKDLCYSARLGQGVWVSPAQGDCVFEDVAKANNSIDHKYMSSTFGIQTYRSNVPCYPTATFEEILVQAVDVGLPVKDFNYTVASSPCRTTIRYMVDAGSKLSECHSLMK
ncbi:NOTCH2 [Symbiodinium sp. CCMP2456]|nr:NOTCH2 [Symbiodinium sp. CCMP2456]